MLGVMIFFLGLICLTMTVIGFKGEIKLLRLRNINLQVLIGCFVLVGLSSTLIGMGIATVVIQTFGF